jgi:hypothetical protein
MDQRVVTIMKNQSFARSWFLNPIYLMGFLIICAACTQFGQPEQMKTPTPADNISIDSWQKYASSFTSDSGTIQYSLRFPKDWIVYSGGTLSAPGLEGQTTIQSSPSTTKDHSDDPVPGGVAMAVYALPYAGTEEGCDTTGFSHYATGLPGTRKIGNRNGWTTWTVYLYVKKYRFSLTGNFTGPVEQKDQTIKLLYHLNK